jgi:hypothetical protein
MRTRALFLVAASSLLFLTTAAHARNGSTAGDVRSGFVADVALGVAIPIGDQRYIDYNDPTFKFAFRVGYEFRLPSIFGIAPEAALDLYPVNLDEGTFRAGGTFTRVRAMGGARLFFHFPIGYAYARFLFGVDYVTGSVNTGFGTLRLDYSSTGFAFAPEVGASFRIWRMLFAGFQVAFPVGTFSFGQDPVRTEFTGVDFDLLGTFSVHL